MKSPPLAPLALAFSTAAAHSLTVYQTHNATLNQGGWFAIDRALADFPTAQCPIFMPVVDVLTEESPPGIVVEGAAPAPDEDLPLRIDLFNPGPGRWFLTYNDSSPPEYRLLRYEGLGFGNCTAVRDGPRRHCKDYNGVKAVARLAFDCLWI